MTMSPIRRQKLFRNGSQPSSETSWVVNPEHFAQNQVVNDGRRSGADQRDAPRCRRIQPRGLHRADKSLDKAKAPAAKGQKRTLGVGTDTIAEAAKIRMRDGEGIFYRVHRCGLSCLD